MKRSLMLTAAGLARPLLALPLAAATVAALAAGVTASTGPATTQVTGPHAATTDSGTWRLLPAAPVSKPPDAIASVWTGHQMIVRGVRWTNQGMRRVTVAYDPAANTWSQLPRGPKPPVTEGSDVAVWTGKEMLLIGPTSAAYNPATGTWRPIPPPRLGGPPSSIAAWTGHEAIVWGGTCCGSTTRVGALYNPATNTWRKITAPFGARRGVEGAWTGRELVLAGGTGQPGAAVQTYKNGAAYNPATNTWRRIPLMPRREEGAAAVWDGREILFLGGYRPGALQPPARGLAFNPVTSTWRKLPAMAYPRHGCAAVWTGRKLLMWGGLTGSYGKPVLPPHGEVYKPATDRWTALPPAPLRGRFAGTSVWTGHSMIVWGGWAPDGSGRFSDGAMYTPRWP
jgi:hypothetical protein